MKCTNCGASLSDSAKFCPECGTKVVRELFCAECGTKLAAGTKFCPECGTKVGGAAAAPTPKAAKESYPTDNGGSKWLTIEDGVLTRCNGDAKGVVIIPEGVTEIGEYAFDYCNIAELEHPCLSIRNGVAVKDGVAMYCASQASEITIPEGVTEIANSAFYVCKALESITLLASVTKIGGFAFTYCESLKQVRYEGTTDEWEEVKQGEGWLRETQVKKVRCSDGYGELSDAALDAYY